MLRLSTAVVLVLLLAACGCAGLVPPAKEIQRETASVVLVNALAHSKRFSKAPDGGVAVSDETTSWSGTGVVIGRTSSDETFVLTAGHVTRQPEVQKNAEEGWLDIFLDTQFQVRTMDGRACDAVSVKVGEQVDLGLLRVQCKIGVPVSYEKEPDYGELITTVGCPGHACESFNRSFFVGDGRWLTKYDHQVMTSLPAWSGASGSPVFHNGNLVGIVFAVDANFNHITYVVPIDEIVKFLGGKDGG